MATECSLTDQMLVEVAKWAIPIAGGLIVVLFTPLVETLKLSVSRGELRIRQYEEFATDLSRFLFQAELQHEYMSASWASQDDLDEITEEYNLAITTLRSKELVYLAWAERYWRPRELPTFQYVLKLVRQVDATIHAFNDGAFTPAKLQSLEERNAELKSAILELLAPKALMVRRGVKTRAYCRPD